MRKTIWFSVLAVVAINSFGQQLGPAGQRGLKTYYADYFSIGVAVSPTGS